MVDLDTIDGNAHLTLIDFNVSKRFNELSSLDDSGTLLYQAPEILEGHPNISEQIDIWSLGCVVYYILSNGQHAFEYEQAVDLHINIVEGRFRQTP